MIGNSSPDGLILIEPLGDRAYLAHFPTYAAAASWAAEVRNWQLAGLTDVVLAYRTVAVFADPDVIELGSLESRLVRMAPTKTAHGHGKELVIPVYYDGADLLDVAAKLALSAAEVIALHSQVIYEVFAIGFLPGFPYCGYLPPALTGLARRETPRLRVPAGSVAIAGRQTAIYPGESPGGWHLLGTTPIEIVDVEAGYFPIRAGDRIRFEPISVSEFEARRYERI